MTEYVRRDLRSVVEDGLADMPVVVIAGPRQSGKSTFLENELVQPRGGTYVTLDDFSARAAALASPEGLLRGDEPIIIDSPHS